MKVVHETVLFNTPWVAYKSKKYLDRANQEREWSYIERNRRQQAAVIVPETEHTKSVILIKQYRIPFEREVIEFPAGLIDPGEDAETTAHRELLEETGYCGKIVQISPEISVSAGITTETFYLVYMIVGEHPDQPPKPGLSEGITVHKIPPSKISAAINRWLEEKCLLDAKVYLHLKDTLFSSLLISIHQP